MSGEKDLDTLLRSLTPSLDPETYVFATTKDPLPASLAPCMTFREAEGTTLVLTRQAAETLALPHEFPCRRITLNVHSSLEAVGFIARIASELARHGMGVNPVSGFFHDHLFVPEHRAAEAMDILARISR